MAILLRSDPNLFCLLSIPRIQIFNNAPYCGVHVLIAEDLLVRIHEKYIHPALKRQLMLLLTPAFTYPPLEKIPLHRPLEKLLGYRNHDPVRL